MIELESPQMALNVPNYYGRYQMWNTRMVYKDVTQHELIGQVRDIAKWAPNGKLKHLVFNCHGGPGNLDVGQGLSAFDIDEIKACWSGLIGVIWMASCNVAKGSTGQSFCARVAAAAGAWVVGAEEFQVIEKWDCSNNPDKTRVCYVPPGRIDDIEGDPQVWNPKGTQSSWNALLAAGLGISFKRGRATM